MKSQKVKVGLIGLGNIGKTHIKNLTTTEQIELVGVCDLVREKADRFAAECETTAYYSHSELFRNSGLEAVIIAVPHYSHPVIAVDAFRQGIHVLCEKPLAIHVNDAKLTIAAYEEAKQKYPELVFGMMFQERTLPFYKKIKEIVDSGDLGRLTRASWINTAWFRSQAYYDSGDWRATWAGEGGGILTNQCPHNLDFYQWVFGVPARISGHAHIGKYHQIEVEDEVTAYFEHESGMVGHFMVTTAESPGVNRLEIVGENGRLLFEKDKLLLFRNRISMLQHLQETNQGFGNVEFEEIEIEVDKDVPTGHKVVTEKFVTKVLTGQGELIAEGTEGILSVTIANGIMLSSFNKQMVELPFDSDQYERILQDLIASSKFRKAAAQVIEADISQSFSK
ncbi:Gfo/Idh/MocA family oxidoreductase [Paenibacillus frigoriresistens]|uniref:Gfo/Idh/MocA family protein n=1 Tax=Paenibacillus alginolyticus TaxID=59839 RepID=UPI001564C7A6|nr:Gfo/Idh/MocA family oxidoreductase [Paenibacillus frigoriresistens]NRF95980.1 Gfo/Idh/MocA family oxidoreductase [Paenibacillus frigoriresistens]